jgi:hypothetical protein
LRPREGSEPYSQKESHIILYIQTAAHLSVTDHQELDRGTLRAVIRGAAVTWKNW